MVGKQLALVALAGGCLGTLLVVAVPSQDARQGPGEVLAAPRIADVAPPRRSPAPPPPAELANGERVPPGPGLPAERLPAAASSPESERTELRVALLDAPMDWGLPRASWRAELASRTDPHVVDALRDDTVKWNATLANGVLASRLGDPLCAATTRAELERALVDPSGDEQLVRLATGLLQWHALEGQAHDPHAPSEPLIASALRMLDRWGTGARDLAMARTVNDKRSVRFALRFFDRTEEGLARELRRRPAEDAFLFAWLLALGGGERWVDATAPILLDHLRDNRMRDDALMSMEALRALGPRVEPWLWNHSGSLDAQQRSCVQLLLLDLRGAAAVPGARPKELNVVTWKFENPVGAWRYLTHHW